MLICSSSENSNSFVWQFQFMPSRQKAAYITDTRDMRHADFLRSDHDSSYSVKPRSHFNFDIPEFSSCYPLTCGLFFAPIEQFEEFSDFLSFAEVRPRFRPTTERFSLIFKQIARALPRKCLFSELCHFAWGKTANRWLKYTHDY